MDYVNDLYKDEIRDGYLVTRSRKAIWQKEIELLMKVDEVCKKYNLQYWAHYGTLLGAIRHKGFIPWDDDLDVVMMRPDYEKFKEVMAKEIEYPYFFSTGYTDYKQYTFSKLIDERTTAVGKDEMDSPPEAHLGIFVDIIPLDPIDDGTEISAKVNLSAREIWTMIVEEKYVVQTMEEGYEPAFGTENMKALIGKSFREKLKVYEQYLLDNFDKSERVFFHVTQGSGKAPSGTKKEWFAETVYMPFENIQIPCPKEYLLVLESRFGKNWQRHIIGKSVHEGIVFSVDIPYKEYLANMKYHGM